MMIRLVALGAFFGATLSGPSGSYRAEIEAYRAQKEKDLRAEDGWLTVVGLPWLAEGRSTIGSAPDSDVVLPASRACALW